MATFEDDDMRLYVVEDDGVPTTSSIEQSEVEEKVALIFERFRDNSIGENVPFLREKHITYLKNGLKRLPEQFECLDASRPWLCYWILHSLALLDSPVSDQLARDVVDFLSHCQSPQGGFGGGPGQLPHLAPTYAAVLALCTLGTPEAYSCIDRPGLQRFLLNMHQQDGSYIMHEDGETDIRGVYCGLVSALLTNILYPELVEGTAEWVASCQTYEGGFSAVPGTEAHGGYTFCGFAALVLLKKFDLCDIPSLLRWAARKQMKVEGGFQGRTNKLVDGCYSFWQGGVFPLIHMALKEKGDAFLGSHWQFNQEALQEYILYCCQSIRGGLLDKPGKSKDYYHTCYCLSGLSVSQHCFGGDKTVNITEDKTALLKPVHPVFNLTTSSAQQAHTHFSTLPVPKLLKTEATSTGPLS